MRACIIEGCNGNRHARGYCNRHYLRWRKHGDPLRVLPPSNRPMHGPANPKWKGDNVKYGAVHARLRRHRGSAAEHPCRSCGKDAEDWAYDRTDLNEQTDPETGFPYSTDLARYFPLCKSCHWRFDRPGQVAS